MRLVLKSIALVAATSVALTVALAVLIISRGGLRSLLNADLLGMATILGWLVALLLGPFAAVQLWRLRQRGRIAALILFGYGFFYYLAGYFWLRSAEAPSGQIIVAAIAHAILVLILALPQARDACS
jgi:hypothetical protein